MHLINIATSVAGEGPVASRSSSRYMPPVHGPIHLDLDTYSESLMCIPVVLAPARPPPLPPQPAPKSSLNSALPSRPPPPPPAGNVHSKLLSRRLLRWALAFIITLKVALRGDSTLEELSEIMAPSELKVCDTGGKKGKCGEERGGGRGAGPAPSHYNIPVTLHHVPPPPPLLPHTLRPSSPCRYRNVPSCASLK